MGFANANSKLLHLLSWANDGIGFSFNSVNILSWKYPGLKRKPRRNVSDPSVTNIRGLQIDSSQTLLLI